MSIGCHGFPNEINRMRYIMVSTTDCKWFEINPNGVDNKTTIKYPYPIGVSYFIFKKWNLHYRYPSGIKNDWYQTNTGVQNFGLRSRTVVRLWSWQQAWHWLCSKAAERKIFQIALVAENTEETEERKTKNLVSLHACHTSNSYGRWKTMHSTICFLGFEGLKAACPHPTKP